ncbi:hypothetical protein JRG42_11050 [Pseudomonas granadensis]|uniref:hypothetical protein n=1 Tax=Pseudomonas granadensis TaxID=1421430 RepID=UPI0019D0B6DC|nr:hypothetical protein [Pseudomonas granadensis]MBN6774156.1 hypothetical protein [Pseudomonas granadensis]MBN6804555.1 hypothetical protein [Pseudomonas granadensis]MBN6831701.1 hypothetical protein [Pseudomonas granadensis]MBN6839230.1 hypothetical protein [Pseudomonas granadensis]MBN6868154.1 hypothetical protein [Pseudomonas granadensis]
MNSTLLLANAIALAVLVGSQFIPERKAPESVAQRVPHYLQVQKAPQLVVLDNQGIPQTVSDSERLLPAATSERLVF